AARLKGRLVRGPVAVALPCRLRLGARRLCQSQQSHQCRTRGCGEGRSHHTFSGNIPPNACGLREAPAERDCRVSQLQHAMSLTGSAMMFLLCSAPVKNKKRTRSFLLSTFAQCAVRVEESASTAGSVLTEVSVGLAFSSSHSIGSGLRTSARAKTSSMRETGTMSRPFLML